MSKVKIVYAEPITFRFPADELPELASRAKKNGMSVHMYARSLVLMELRRAEGEKQQRTGTEG